MLNNRKKSDEELIRELQAGRNEAFDEIVDRFTGQLHNFIYRIVGNRTVAEDLLQETFIRLWTHRDKYREIARFSTWLYTVAGNLAKSELRKQRIRRYLSLSSGSGYSRDSEDEKVFELPDKTMDPNRDYERRNIVIRVEEEIQELPLVFREVVVLRDVQELSYEEIGLILKIPLGTVKSRINRARQRLQARLKDIHQ
ncbi:MAG: sigma-70 family RNA polymerase sigma factor [Candidatus Hatepunaea meridiana]|nr:sigma-70 family RNA polymerase sigma factor [Candidatus Hatepunaea meridiana]